MTTARHNVDAAEVAKFDALAARWWDPDGEFRSLHQINPLRLDWIRKYADLDGHMDLVRDPASGGFEVRDGCLHVAERPGLGVEATF